MVSCSLSEAKKDVFTMFYAEKKEENESEVDEDHISVETSELEESDRKWTVFVIMRYKYACNIHSLDKYRIFVRPNLRK